MDVVHKVVVYSKYKKDPLELKCRSVTVTPDAVMTQAPVETGVFINDCKVRRPITVQLQVVLPIVGTWYSVIKKIRSLHEQFVVVKDKAIKAEKENLASVATRDGLYKNLVLLNCPHTEGVENFSNFEFTLKFQELLLVGSSDASSVEKPDDSNPVYGGKQ